MPTTEIAERAESLLREILDSPEVLMTPQLRKIARSRSQSAQIRPRRGRARALQPPRRARRRRTHPTHRARPRLRVAHGRLRHRLDAQTRFRLPQLASTRAPRPNPRRLGIGRPLRQKAQRPRMATGPNHRRPSPQVGQIPQLLVEKNRPRLNHRPQREALRPRRRSPNASHLRQIPRRASRPHGKGSQLGPQRASNPRPRVSSRLHQ